MKNGLKWHGKHVFEAGRSMEESAMKIGSNGEKIATRDLAVCAAKRSHDRDNWRVVAMILDRSESQL